MTGETRRALKVLIDQKVRQKCEDGYLDCDPESLSIRADEAELAGFTELADALRHFRDQVVNPLLGEGWDLNRIENAALRHFKGKNG